MVERGRTSISVTYASFNIDTSVMHARLHEGIYGGCDASGHSIGVVLMQEQKPTTYFKKGLSSRLLAKPAYEKELMALVLAVQHLRPYLLGRHFVVRSNQQSIAIYCHNH